MKENNPSPLSGKCHASNLLGIFACLTLAACPDSDLPIETSASAGSTGSTTGASSTTETGASASSASTSSGAPTSGSSTASNTDSTSTTTSGDSTETGNTESSTETSGPEDPCGNGILDPGEECDLGPENSNEGECSKACKLAICGDHITQEGEECDEGEDNHPNKYAGCTPECTFGPFCGDGATQKPFEQCDPNDPMLGGDPTICDSCMWAGKRIFVSSTTFNGDLGGLDGADASCQDLASNAGLTADGQIFRAWLSTTEKSAAERLQHSDLPYVRVDGSQVAMDWPDLVDGLLMKPIELDENGVKVQDARVWTNTRANGSTRSAQSSCDAWNSAEGGSAGHLGLFKSVNIEWTQATKITPIPCLKFHRIYCLEQ